MNNVRPENETVVPEQAMKYKEGKTRYDLLPVYPLECVAKVLTKGLIENGGKYPPNNWRKGRPWTDDISALERHLASFKGRNDVDPEDGEHHLAHLICDALFLLEHTVLHPENDDRPGRLVDRNGEIQTEKG